MLIRLFFSFLSCFLFATSMLAQCNPAPQSMPQIPTPLSNFYVIVADKTFTQANFNEPPWGGFFDTDIMARNAAQKIARRDEAIAFFNSRFGVNFTALTVVDRNSDSNPEYMSSDGKFILQYYMTPGSYDDVTRPADYGQKVVYSGNETVPTAGWTVNEAYYKMEALVDYAPIAGSYVTSAEVQAANPGATSLPVMLGTFAVHGEYRINYASPCTGNIDLKYYSIRPTFPDFFSTSLGLVPTATFDYDVVFNPDNGRSGIARGIAKLTPTGVDTYKTTVRTIIKFTP